MLHEFEEIIGVERWFTQNAPEMKARFPRLSKPITALSGLSTRTFAGAVLEEFVLVSTCTVLALTCRWYGLWLAAFAAFSVHILVHIGQWLVVRHYIPVIITSVLALPYIVWGMIHVVGFFPVSSIVLYSVAGIVVAVLNLALLHRFILH